MPDRSLHISLNLKGYLMDLEIPKVMGVLNVTPDSFYSGSRCPGKMEVKARAEEMVNQGVDIIDIGGCSTRPGFEAPSPEEEWERISIGCEIVRELAPDIPVSIDTFRASVARKASDTWDIEIVNDISGGIDPDMWPLIAERKIVYVLTHNRENNSIDYDNVVADVITELSIKVNELHRLGICDVIIDPGFGFSKSTEQNFELLASLHEVKRMGLPILVGISRKSMIYKTLDVSPEESLAGTVALDAIALEKGADILRVHDVKAAADTVALYKKLIPYTKK